MADLKCGDIRDFWGYGPCVVLDVTPDNYWVFSNFGKCELLPKNMEYKSVQLDKEHREALFNYWQIYNEIGKANYELDLAKKKVRVLEKILSDKGEEIAKKYGDLSYKDFLERVKVHGRKHLDKLHSYGYDYDIEEIKDNHSLRVRMSLTRQVKYLRENPDYIIADFDDSAIIKDTKQYREDLQKYTNLYLIELVNTMSSNAAMGVVNKVKKLEMDVGPLWLIHDITIQTPFIHYNEKTAKLVADLFKTK